MYSSIKTIKSTAKEQLLSHMWTAVLFTLFYLLITNLCTFCLAFSPSSGNVFSFLFYEMNILLINLFSGLLQTGIAAFYLNLFSERQHCTFSDLFHAFSHGPDKTLKVTLVLSLINTVCTLPYAIYSLFFMPEFTMEQLFSFDYDALKYMLFAYTLLTLGELIYFFISLNFAPVYFMLVDMPNLSAAKALKMSSWLMKGSKLRLLGLELSFLPLQFVSLLTFGIGNLWIIPYKNTAAAAFYVDLSQKRTNQ